MNCSYRVKFTFILFLALHVFLLTQYLTVFAFLVMMVHFVIPVQLVTMVSLQPIHVARVSVLVTLTVVMRTLAITLLGSAYCV